MFPQDIRKGAEIGAVCMQGELQLTELSIFGEIEKPRRIVTFGQWRVCDREQIPLHDLLESRIESMQSQLVLDGAFGIGSV